MIFIALVLMFLSLARPQWGVEQRTSDPRGIDILIAVDVSKSMLARMSNQTVSNGLSSIPIYWKSQRRSAWSDCFQGPPFSNALLHWIIRHLKTLDQLEIGIIKT